MEFRQTVSGAELNNVFVNIPQAFRNKRVEVVVVPVGDADVLEKPDYSCKVGFLDIPPLPESFFDPLPEEELQAWGL